MVKQWINDISIVGPSGFHLWNIEALTGAISHILKRPRERSLKYGIGKIFIYCKLDTEKFYSMKQLRNGGLYKNKRIPIAQLMK